MVPASERLQLPTTPPTPRRQGLPVVALVAPLAMSVALWVMTASPYALVLAVFGPVIALVGWLEARRARRRDRRAAVRDTLRRIDDLHARLDTRFNTRRAELMRRSTVRIDESSSAVSLRLGTGPTPSGIVVEGDDAHPETELVAAIRRLRSHAATIPDAPILLTSGEAVIVVDGPAALVHSLARSLVMQTLTALPLDGVIVHVPDGEWWARELPVELRVGSTWEAARDGRRVLRVERGVVAGPDATLIRASDSAPPRIVTPVPVQPVRLALMCAAEAAVQSRELAARARAAGWRPASAMPVTVGFGSLPEPDDGQHPLTAVVGVGARGPAVFDLERDGPHALIAGTTGSGKSELLVTWVLALARAHAPAELSFLLIDFKGGASFAPVRDLPHVVGMVSDLDPASAERAVASLRAELLRRERVLATHGVRSLSELPPGVLARLVIVVDEFAALVAVDPALQAVFSDLAARGRTLGLHVILCTQRPAGVIRESVLANVTLRVCLRVLDAADSVAVIGHPAAAELPADARGRGLRAGTPAGDPVQFALTTPADVEAVRRRWASSPPATGRPWLDPLPTRLTPQVVASLPAPPAVSGVAMGAVDLPDRQRQEQLIVDPWGSGSLLVVGAAGSGRSTALEMLAQATDAHVRRVPDDPAELWQALTAPTAGRVLVVADDLDRTLAWADPEIRADLAELISRAARDTRRSGIALAASTRGTGGAMHAVQGAFEQRLVLRMASREEHLLAGAELAAYRSERRAGSCVWAGRDAQISLPSGQVGEPWRATLPSVDLTEQWAVVIGRHDALTSFAPGPATTVKDVDGWLSDHGGLERARRSGRLILVGCTAADHRALTRARAPLPPLAGHDEAWLFEGASTSRVRLLRRAGQARPSGDSSAVSP